jgi:hypothetical protein
MPKNLKQHGPAPAARATPILTGRPPFAPPADDFIDATPALDCSRVTNLLGRPYPVQFRKQGAIDAWTRALENTEVWRRWQSPDTLCWSIRQEVSWQLGYMHPMYLVPNEETEKVTANRRMLAVEVSTNLKYHLNKGTVIEATPPLETLLTNSDADLSLPMSIVAPPYGFQYLRFGEDAMQYLKVPNSQAPEITRDEIAAIGLRKKREASNATANRYLSLIRAILRKACLEWEWIERVPK